MRELRKYNGDIACLLKVRITDSGHSGIKVPGEEACYHLYHSGLYKTREGINQDLESMFVKSIDV